MDARPLEDVTVLDFTQSLAGPFASVMLADQGADVLTVERPEGGTQRQFVRSSIFPLVGRNKRSVALDLKRDDADDVVRRLVEAADVVIHNFAPGTMERLGCDYETCQEYNEDIVYCSITGFGDWGPYRDRTAYDPLAQAMSGLMAITGEPDRKPSRVGGSLIDMGTGVFAAYGIMIALWQREMTGEGQKVEASLFDTAASFMGYWYTYVDLYGEVPTRNGSHYDPYAPYGLHLTGETPVYIAIARESQWEAFCAALDREDWVTDARFETNDDRTRNRAELTAAIEEEFESWPLEELLETLWAANVPVAEQLPVEAAAEDEHLHERGTLTALETVDGDEVTGVGTPVKFSEESITFDRPPEIGEHTVEVLREVGCSEDEIRSITTEE